VFEGKMFMFWFLDAKNLIFGFFVGEL
jgi:hypothetical protein